MTLYDVSKKPKKPKKNKKKHIEREGEDKGPDKISILPRYLLPIKYLPDI